MSIKKKKERERFSRLRQNLVNLSKETLELITPCLSDTPVMKGSVYELKTKCGKKTCKCADGDKHTRMVLSASHGGRTRMRVVPVGRLVEIQTKVNRYKRIRKARGRLRQIQGEMVRIMDEMESMRKEKLDD